MPAPLSARIAGSRRHEVQEEQRADGGDRRVVGGRALFEVIETHGEQRGGAEVAGGAQQPHPLSMPLPLGATASQVAPNWFRPSPDSWPGFVSET
jgi:hypothetical protein